LRPISPTSFVVSRTEYAGRRRPPGGSGRNADRDALAEPRKGDRGGRELQAAGRSVVDDVDDAHSATIHEVDESGCDIGGIGRRRNRRLDHFDRAAAFRGVSPRLREDRVDVRRTLRASGAVERRHPDDEDPWFPARADLSPSSFVAP